METGSDAPQYQAWSLGHSVNPTEVTGLDAATPGLLCPAAFLSSGLLAAWPKMPSLFTGVTKHY